MAGVQGFLQVGFEVADGHFALLARQFAQLFHVLGDLAADNQRLLFSGFGFAGQQLQQAACLRVIAHQVGLDLAYQLSQRRALPCLLAQRQGVLGKPVQCLLQAKLAAHDVGRAELPGFLFLYQQDQPVVQVAQARHGIAQLLLFAGVAAAFIGQQPGAPVVVVVQESHGTEQQYNQ